MTNHAVYPKLIILSYWNAPSIALFLFKQMFGQMVAIVAISFFGNVKNSVDIVMEM